MPAPGLYRILRTVLSDLREKSGRRQQLVHITRLEEAHDEILGGDKDALFSEVVARLDGEAVHRSLAEIPEDFAAAVELHDIDGFKYTEIAEIAGVPIGTVMSRANLRRRCAGGATTSMRDARRTEEQGDHPARDSDPGDAPLSSDRMYELRSAISGTGARRAYADALARR